ncbi:bifunctional polysaccharide deacetylase/glycosyltransferase family 2 protein [Cryptosporangium minutisporangium]|uniref:Glycosyltransferase n=1 Tax=Cryptosporangium minutisporangium TaxID=113569 RepID=A0ABP6T7Q9_9ACTN
MQPGQYGRVPQPTQYPQPAQYPPQQRYPQPGGPAGPGVPQFPQSGMPANPPTFGDGGGPAGPGGGDGGEARNVPPRPRFLFVAFLLLVLVAVLMVQAYVQAQVATPKNVHNAGASDEVPKEILNGGPIIDTTHDKPYEYSLPAKHIALTFDDGPDPEWTPKILDLLKQYKVRATFFVVGSAVTEHPDLVERMVDEGHEVGIHSFTHPEMSEMSAWERKLQYSQTQMAIVGAAGVTTSLLRFPYSSQPDAIDNVYWPIVVEAGKLGYLNVVNDTDSRDWAKPGPEKIVENAYPKKGQGAVSLFHDAGGDREQTIDAMKIMLPKFTEEGYKFVTVGEGLKLSPDWDAGDGSTFNAMQPATSGEIWRGKAMIWVVQASGWFVKGLVAMLTIVGVLTLARLVLMLVLATVHARKRRAKSFRWGPEFLEPVSVVVPAYNEKEGIAAAVRSLATSNYPMVEVIVVDDGSSDNTAEIAESLGFANVRVVRVPNGGKPAALNIGTAWARADIIVMVDGDTIFEPDSVYELVQPFADPRVGGVAGNVKVGNRQSIVARWQHIEYVIGFNLDRRMYDILQCMPTIPGAIGAFRREALNDVGGVSHETLAEDTDLTIAMGRAGWKVVYEEKARAWTEAPSTIQQLWRQRYRWSYGTMQAMWKHRHAVVEKGPSGRFGRFGLIFLGIFQVGLPLFAPLIDVFALYGLVAYDATLSILAWVGMLALQFFLAVFAFKLDKEKLGPLWSLPAQQFVYRQLMYAVMIQSVVTALTGARLRWHKLHRTGLTAPGQS